MHIMQENREECPLYLNLIFEKDSNGNYTNDALLYQDILEFLFEINDKEDSFRFNEIAGWLVMKKNREFLNYYSDNKSRTPKQHRINARRRRIQGHIDDLQKMQLIFNIGPVKARRNNESTPLYIYSKYGQIIAWIIKRNTTDILNDENELRKLVPARNQELTKLRNMAEENIINIIQSIFPGEKSDSVRTSNLYCDREHLSKNIMKYRFFNIAKENGIISIIINGIRILLQREIELSMSDLFDRIVYGFYILAPDLKEKVWNTFIATLNSLDETTRRMILFYEKIDIESGIHKRPDHILPQWEKLWLENISNCDKLVLFGDCTSCMEHYPVVVDYYKYKRRMFLLRYRTSNSTQDMFASLSDCNKCNMKGKLVVSTWVGEESKILSRLVA